MPEQDPLPDGLEAIGGLDRLVHEPARMSIMAHLYVVDSADFLFLMRLTGLTRGNLSSHMSKLEEAGYIEVVKTFRNKIPNTMLRLTEKGRQAFRDYTEQMRGIIGRLPE
jgi:DNA-binding MarR family transcriptional regulator